MLTAVRSEATPGLVKQMVTALASLKTRLFGTTTRARSTTTIIVGVNALTHLLATELEAAGKPVSLIDLENGAQADGEIRDQLVLSSAGAKAASCIMAATANDEWNLSLCRTARHRFRVPMVIARVGLLGGMTSWVRLNDVGMVRITWMEMVPAILGTVTPSSGLDRVARATDREQIADVELLTPVFLGRTIADLALEGCEVIALRRKDLWVDDIDHAELRRGDVLTLVGAKTALNKVRESFTTL